jgi:hypothetical protein
MAMSKIAAVLVGLIVLASASCEDDAYKPGYSKPPISVFAVTAIDGLIYANLMPPTLPDPFLCRLTLHIENTSTRYSYSDISIPAAIVYQSPNNQPLGKIFFSTDWDGTLEAGEIDTVVVDKIKEDYQIFPTPCGASLYLDVFITTTKYGDMIKRTPTYTCSCVY